MQTCYQNFLANNSMRFNLLLRSLNYFFNVSKKTVLTRISIFQFNSWDLSWIRIVFPKFFRFTNFTIFAARPKKFKFWSDLSFFTVVANLESISSVPSDEKILYEKIIRTGDFIALWSLRDELIIYPQFKIGVSE